MVSRRLPRCVTWTGRNAAAVPDASVATGRPQGGSPDGTAGAFVIRPKLYVLAIGVSQYTSSDIPRLGLAAKDADDFATTIAKQNGKLYRDVQVRL